ncbi:LacI family DNA-binding transcriptional regulator [Asticcacaulis sp. EMRT-3]|uniref:LacI family DNA-binding transcriptional regulator n=1 Tax=Asticcacaulis sp. EMRT-3 TaxID=3040349 RepID=UPI0024AF9EE5|nr:LacI family DNA-binding transcriptional regulator [Asticcacaulis sp. EMRT-3]MDI7774220.1 LacI family DNA-binding transcriptional regulator [Asticcacaulis sp. EMRT-3]
MPTRAPTIYDVAALSGVGRTTVSRVLNGEAHVAEATRDRVLAAVRKLRYRVNAQARMLAGGRSHALMVIYPVNDEVGPHTWYNLLIESGALRACGKAGLQLLMQQVFPHSLQKHQRVMDLIDSHACDGLILAPPFSDDAELIAMIRARHMPVACIAAGPQTRDLAPGIGIDDEAAGYDLTRYLLDLGHRRFAFIDGLRDHISASLRYAGFCRALTSQGLDPASAATARGNLTFHGGYERLDALMTARPTAIICANDDMAAGALYRAHQLGLSVPRDLTIAGFDDAPFSQIVWPPLTTISQPVFDMAQRAVDIVLQAIASPHLTGAYELMPHRVVIRDSAVAPAA